jgi:hypothetical protein
LNALRAALIALVWLIGSAATLSLPVREDRGMVTVRAEAGLEHVATRVADNAADVLHEILEDLPELDVPETVEIRLVKSTESLSLAAPTGRGAPEWADGVAYSDVGIVVVANHRNHNLINVDSTVAHELAHLALGAALHGKAPRWLNEGFAYLHSSEWSVARTQTLTGIAWSGSPIPLHEIDRRFPARKSDVERAYAQSYDFVAFLARRGRFRDNEDDGNRWPFRDFLGAIARGRSVDEAARSAYGASLSQLHKEWFEDLRQRYMLVPASLVGLFVWVLAAALLILGYRRKQKRARQILALWEAEETARAEARAAAAAAAAAETA